MRVRARRLSSVQHTRHSRRCASAATRLGRGCSFRRAIFELQRVQATHAHHRTCVERAAAALRGAGRARRRVSSGRRCLREGGIASTRIRIGAAQGARVLGFRGCSCHRSLGAATSTCSPGRLPLPHCTDSCTHLAASHSLLEPQTEALTETYMTTDEERRRRDPREREEPREREPEEVEAHPAPWLEPRSCLRPGSTRETLELCCTPALIWQAPAEVLAPACGACGGAGPSRRWPLAPIWHR